VSHLYGSEFEYWLEKSMLWLTNRELRGMDTHSNAASTGGCVVAEKCTLSPLIEATIGCQCKWTCRDDLSQIQRGYQCVNLHGGDNDSTSYLTRQLTTLHRTQALEK
jgi:hypothetical protein